MSAQQEELREEAAKAVKSKKKLEELVENLSSGSRRERQRSAAIIAAIAKENAEPLVTYSKEIIDALNRPEAQTRWEALDALTNMVALDSRACEKAVAGAETALFDEDSGPLRLSAMRFMCRLGATTENRSEKIWPVLDEAIQCYHGDLEFQDMLIAVIDFSSGKLAPQVKKELVARMKFDADNAKGQLGRRASQIVKNAS